ncbi:Immunoglobulin domain and Immunoglobulin fold domain-containing protein [Trichostrongylus colubriformis]|uniref:Immunoglobulin domain and Immunoglobulin fold domain-containing protein n=1 Tax=Trichostrongylus colubriformis TaxID=6319 RepID=A0AAN8FJY2_TRICO
MKTLILLLLFMVGRSLAQMQQMLGAQVKITGMPFAVSNAQQLNQIVWTMLGTTTKETIYCVSEAPVSQLRFVCIDCLEKNITDMANVLNSAQDHTRSAGFPTVALSNVAVNTNWTGATIMCQAALNGGTVDSQPATVDVRYLRQPHVVDASGQGPVLIASQGYRFYVECARGADGLCQQSGRRKTLRCAVQAHPPATVFRWLKNGVVTSGNGAEITIGTEMIGQSIQCQANNGLYSDTEMATSQAVQIDPYSSARLIQDNFATLQSAAPFQAGNRLEMNQQINLGCQVEGNPRPVVFWKLRKSNGQVVDAPCAQGFDGQYQEVTEPPRERPIPPNVVRLNAICSFRVSNYSLSGQYWCSACSYVSQGAPECSPALETPGTNTLNIQVTGPPMQSDSHPTIEQAPGSNNAVVTVHYCAEPMPRPPREVIFSIDKNDLQIGQSWENFRFESTTQNNTVPNCYLARLNVAPVREEDQYRVIELRLQNQYGSKQIPVSLEALLGGGATSGARISGWWIAFFVLIAICLALVCCVAFCVRRGVLCFNKVKEQSDYNEPKAKANLNVRENFYDADAPRLYTPQSVENTPYDLAVQAAYCDSRMSSV